jgi:hypothetical protein
MPAAAGARTRPEIIAAAFRNFIKIQVKIRYDGSAFR